MLNNILHSHCDRTKHSPNIATSHSQVDRLLTLRHHEQTGGAKDLYPAMEDADVGNVHPDQALRKLQGGTAITKIHDMLLRHI